MTNRLLPFGAMAALIVVVFTAMTVAGAFGDDSGAADLRGDGEEAADAAALCVEGAEDCEDMIVSGEGDIDTQDDIADAPPPDGATDPVEVCAEGEPECDDIVSIEDPDEPVSSGDDLPPDDGGSGDDPGAPDRDEELAVDAAFAALAEMGVDTDVEVSGLERVEWPDSCLGIEQEGVACAEVITPGYIVFLSGAGGDYKFHTDLNGNAVFAPR